MTGSRCRPVPGIRPVAVAGPGTYADGSTRATNASGHGQRIPRDRVVRAAEAMGEATVPAEQPAAGQTARIPAPDVDAGRPGDHQGAPRQGSRPPVGLIWRVRDRATFAALGRATRVRRGPLSVAWLDDGRPPPPRVAFAVSRRVGSAVTRNRLRRRLRELARRSELRPGVWFVSAGAGAADAPYAALSAWWSDAVTALAGRQ
jgi:ribonuclease P protein component